MTGISLEAFFSFIKKSFVARNVLKALTKSHNNLIEYKSKIHQIA